MNYDMKPIFFQLNPIPQDRPCQRDGSQDAALLLLPSLEHRRKPAALSGGLEKGTMGMIIR